MKTDLIEAPDETPALGARREMDLVIDGMTCSNCARHVTEALQEVPGVSSASVTLAENRARVKWKADASPDEKALFASLQEAGYSGKIQEHDSHSHAHENSAGWSPIKGWRFNVVFGLCAVIPLMILEWGFRVGMERWYHWLAFALALPVQVLCGWRFYRGAWIQLKSFQSNMDTLVALGSSAAFLYSVWGVFAGWHRHLYFMDAAAIITLISLGHWMEAKASAQAENSLKSLLNLAPDKARRRSKDGHEVEVTVHELQVGDKVMLRPGDRIPTDGKIVEGSSSVDESMLTGESLPQEKAAGARLYAGTLNVDGRLVMEVAATGDATALARIVEIVRHAQSSRANIQKLGDKVSSIFVPIVVVIALLTAIWWGFFTASAMQFSNSLAAFLWTPHLPTEPLAAAIFHMAAVLIIACPCAMGLATPIAIMAGTNAAAKRGILIRDGAALEKSGKISAVLFDKTGTLTTGKISVADVALPEGEAISGVDVKALAASLARPSNHPFSQAVAQLSDANITLTDWQETRGSGVSGNMAEILSGRVHLGSINWAKANGVMMDQQEDFINRWANSGATILALSSERKLFALFACQDTLKPNATEVVRRLVSSGKQVYLVTGDNHRTAQAIATQAGIPKDRLFSEVRPEGKVEVIQKLQQQGVRVAFVGDGINDAPALEQADLGIVLSNASDVAREAADIILLRSGLEGIPESIGLAQATLRTIKQNLFWAFFYNAAGVPLAALGFFSPILSAAAMGISDLLVVGNALKLRYWRR
ncbi:MAG: heavy metal translocating P-type ATPase [Verrucomicrobiales bacterium]